MTYELRRTLNDRTVSFLLFQCLPVFRNGLRKVTVSLCIVHTHSVTPLLFHILQMNSQSELRYQSERTGIVYSITDWRQYYPEYF